MELKCRYKVICTCKHRNKESIIYTDQCSNIFRAIGAYIGLFFENLQKFKSGFWLQIKIVKDK